MSNQPTSKEASIWEALNLWGHSLPDWQRHLVTYAAREGKLTEDRVSEAYSSFLQEQGLSENSKPKAVLPNSITGRSGSDNNVKIELVELRNLKSVNAISESAEVTFGQGLTVIYGNNGAGKSGLARILSAACFSRSKQTILPNVYDDEQNGILPSADISVQIGGRRETITVAIDTEHPELRRFSVFDSTVAQIHLSEETTLGFQPAGFDVFDEVVNAINAISSLLDADIKNRTSENKFTKIFIGDSAVSKTICELSANSDLENLKTQAVYGLPEAERLKEIDRQITDLKTRSAVELLKQKADARSDLADLQQRAQKLTERLGQDACNTFISEMLSLKRKLEKSLAVSIAGTGDSSFTKTGNSQWEAFAKAAKTLRQAEFDSYPREGNPCLLCHRPLDRPSTTLIQRFWSFLDNQERLEAEAANETLSVISKQLESIDTKLLPESSRIRADLTKLLPKLVVVINTFSDVAEARKQTILAYLGGLQTELICDDLVSPIEEIVNCDRALVEEISVLHADDVALALDRCQAEHTILRHRQVLSQNIDDICAYVIDLRWVEKASISKKLLSTRFATEKQKQLFQTLIEGNYKDTLKNECKALDATLPIEFKSRGSSGKTLRGLQIQGGHKPVDILSEGEQKAVALADFLTEVNINPSAAGIILDDPVTSLDHRRKRKIAERLAFEAQQRQVIVFTHDLVFLSLLLDCSGNAEVVTHWVNQGPDGLPGNFSLNDCPANSDAYKTPHRAREALANAKKVNGQRRVDFIRAGASALRNTLEEIIIRDLFNGTVRRWHEQIRIGNIKSISWSDTVADEICSLQDDISRLIDAHSTSDEFSGGMPETHELESLIERVQLVQAAAKKHRK